MLIIDLNGRLRVVRGCVLRLRLGARSLRVGVPSLVKDVYVGRSVAEVRKSDKMLSNERIVYISKFAVGLISTKLSHG